MFSPVRDTLVAKAWTQHFGRGNVSPSEEFDDIVTSLFVLYTENGCFFEGFECLSIRCFIVANRSAEERLFFWDDSDA